MKITFSATQANTTKDYQAIIAGVTNKSGDYVMFQRSTNKDDDEGVYFELNDQINSGYEIVKECKISKNLLEIYLIEPFENLQKALCISIDLNISEAEYVEFIKGIKSIFFDKTNKIQIVA